jgi:hypothetical protein
MRKAKVRVILFLSNEMWQERLWNQINKYMAEDLIEANFMANSSGYFLEVTRDSGDYWDLLVTDKQTIDANTEMLVDFVNRNAGIIVCVNGDPAQTPFTDAIQWEENDPDPVDSFLSMMYRLLNSAAERRDRWV